MDMRSPAEIAEEWIGKWTAGGPGVGTRESALDGELPGRQPDLCLAAILEVLGRVDVCAPNPLLGVLAAGPLENLLHHGGEIVLDRVDVLARRDPGFRLLLNGVWDGSLNPSVRDRLARYRGDPW